MAKDKVQKVEVASASETSFIARPQLTNSAGRLVEGPTVKRKPKWMDHYQIVSYIIYGTIAGYSLFYLIFVGIYQAHPRMQIQYTSVVKYQEYNSYSILAPLLCPVFMGMLAYQVKNKVSLAEGDFFGVLGFLLFLALMCIHDGWGMYLLCQKNESSSKRKVLVPHKQDFNSRNSLAWQYAWSTKPACAKRYVRNLIYEFEYAKKHVKRKIVVHYDDKAAALDLGRQFDPLSTCNKYHDAKSKARIRSWMKDLHKEYKCCGPYGYDKWEEWFDDPINTGCDLTMTNTVGNVSIPGCYDPVIRWLDGILYSSFWIMLTQAFLYVVVMITALAHHTAMKYEHNRGEKEHSLLNVTELSKEEEETWWREARPVYNPMVVGTNVVDEAHEHEHRPAVMITLTENSK